MIIDKDGYCIEQYLSQNKIIITLPQTPHTSTTTGNGTSAYSLRKVKLNDVELGLLLTVANRLFEGGKE